MGLQPAAAQLAAELHRSGKSIFLGYEGGTATFAQREDHVTVLGPPRSGKSSAIFAPSVAVHPGPVIVTSTRAAGLHIDLRDVTVLARQRVGAADGEAQVYELYLDEAIPPLAGNSTSAVSWSVASGCDEWNSAVERARSLAGAAVPMSEQNAQYWRSALTTFIAPILHWVAICNADDEQILEWAAIGAVDEAYASEVDGSAETVANESGYYGLREQLASYYQHHGYHPALRFCDDILSSSDEVRQNVRHVAMTQVFGYLSFEPAPDVELTSFSIDQFLSAWSTLYITIRPQRAEQYRTLIAAFIDAIASRWQARAHNPRAGTLLLALDEVANVAPVATLPEIIAAGGGSGIQVMLGFQSPGQARRRWGDEGVETIVRGPTHTIIFPALADRAFLDDTAALFGEEDQHIFDVTADTQVAGEVEARDLIRLRQDIERIRGELRHAPVLAQQKIKLEVGTRYAQEARLRIDPNRPVITAESVLVDVLRRTMVTERVERRYRVTGAEIFRGEANSVFVLTRQHGSRLPSFVFRTTPGWWVDDLWKAVMDMDST